MTMHLTFGGSRCLNPGCASVDYGVVVVGRTEPLTTLGRENSGLTLLPGRHLYMPSVGPSPSMTGAPRLSD